MSEDSIRVSPGRPVGGATTGRGGRRPAFDDLPLELLVLGLLSLAILIAAAVDEGFGARSAWLYVTILGAAFILARGLAAHRR